MSGSASPHLTVLHPDIKAAWLSSMGIDGALARRAPYNPPAPIDTAHANRAGYVVVICIGLLAILAVLMGYGVI